MSLQFDCSIAWWLCKAYHLSNVIISLDQSIDSTHYITSKHLIAWNGSLCLTNRHANSHNVPSVVFIIIDKTGFLARLIMRRKRNRKLWLKSIYVDIACSYNVGQESQQITDSDEVRVIDEGPNSMAQSCNLVSSSQGQKADKSSIQTPVGITRQPKSSRITTQSSQISQMSSKVLHY